MSSCVTSSPSLCVALNVNPNKYRHVVLSNENECPREYDGTLLQIQKEVSTNLNVVSDAAARSLQKDGIPVLVSSVYIEDSKEKRKNSDNVINLYFKDFVTKENVVIIKCEPDENFLGRQLRTDLKAAFRYYSHDK